jgi:RNA polymerase sigma-70 factor (ECF subfamily)
MDEDAWIRAAQRGDQDAFERLVRAHDQGVLRLALNFLRSPEDASDVYQETFLRVYRNLHAFRFDCSFRTWLYRIAANLCLDQLRKRKIRREEASTVETSGGPRDLMGLVRERRAHGDPERAVLSRELDARIRNVLNGFTPRERMVFELRHYDGMRLRAIGEVLGSSEEAAKNCLFRVTRKLRAALGDFV